MARLQHLRRRGQTSHAMQVHCRGSRRVTPCAPRTPRAPCTRDLTLQRPYASPPTRRDWPCPLISSDCRLTREPSCVALAVLRAPHARTQHGSRRRPYPVPARLVSAVCTPIHSHPSCNTSNCLHAHLQHAHSPPHAASPLAACMPSINSRPSPNALGASSRRRRLPALPTSPHTPRSIVAPCASAGGPSRTPMLVLRAPSVAGSTAGASQVLSRLREDVLLERVLVEEGGIVLAHVEGDGGVGLVGRGEVFEEELDVIEVVHVGGEP